MARTKGKGVLGVFKHVDLCADAIRELKGMGKRMNVYSPVPDHTIEAALDEKKSPLGWATMIAAFTGTACGFGLSWYATHSYDLVVQGKPLNAPIPWLVVGFELTILIGCLANFIALIVLTRLPRLRRDPGYDKRFSLDAFGVFVSCGDEEVPKVKEVLEQKGAVEVHERQ